MDRDQLVEALNKLPGNPRILLSMDAEGNEFSALIDLSVEYVYDHYAGERTEDIFNEDDLRDDNDGEIPEGFDPVVVLWRI
jgi:hypothetical protein